MPTPQDPNVNLKLGVDLSDRASLADADAEAAARAEEARKTAYARAWDAMMQRAFKGIYTRKMRHDGMRRALKRREREEAEAEV